MCLLRLSKLQLIKLFDQLYARCKRLKCNKHSWFIERDIVYQISLSVHCYNNFTELSNRIYRSGDYEHRWVSFRAKKGKKGKRSSKKKKGRRGGKKSKKKKEKDLTPDRTLESLFEELITNGNIFSAFGVDFPKIRFVSITFSFPRIWTIFRHHKKVSRSTHLGLQRGKVIRQLWIEATRERSTSFFGRHSSGNLKNFHAWKIFRMI